jgi:hypothetical protein
MSRNLTAAMVTEFTSDMLSPIILIDAEFDSGNVRLWTGYGDITFDGNTYQGGGDLLGVSVIDEVESIEANNVTLSLSGIPSSLISTALTEQYQDRPVRVYFGALDESTGALIGDPELMFRGRMDVMRIQEAGDTATISVKCENNLIILTRNKERRYTDSDQKLDYPNDTFFDQVDSIQDAEVVWGKGQR